MIAYCVVAALSVFLAADAFLVLKGRIAAPAKPMGRPLAWILAGAAVQFFRAGGNEWSWLIVPGMLASGWGLWLYHRAKGHPDRYVLAATACAALPYVGPLVGLALSPASQAAPEPPALAAPSAPPRTAGMVLLLAGLVLYLLMFLFDFPAALGIVGWAVCLVGTGLAAGRANWALCLLCLVPLLGPLLSFGYLAQQHSAARRGSPKWFEWAMVPLCLTIFLKGCAIFSHNHKFDQLIRKSNEAATKGSLGELRHALGGAGKLPVTIPPAKTVPHRDSSAVLRAARSDDGGGWLLDEKENIWVNCTHTDTKGSAWTSY